jgi:hypothetical protein
MDLLDYELLLIAYYFGAKQQDKPLREPGAQWTVGVGKNVHI